MGKRFKERTLGIPAFSDWEDEKEPAKKTDRKWSSSASDRVVFQKPREKSVSRKRE